jgi:hypothetical protein
MRNNKNIALFSVFIIPIFYFLFFTYNNTVFGHDARFIMDNFFTLYHSPIIANLFMVSVWFSVLFSFTFIENKKQNPLFLGSIYLLNLFNVRLLMPDPDNWIFILSGIFLVLYFKNNPIEKLRINHITTGIFTVFMYFAYRGFSMTNLKGFADMTPNLLVFCFLLPTYYILIKKRYFVILVPILASILIFPTGKYVTNALPILIYAIYADFMSKEGLELEKDRIMRFMIIFGLGAFLFAPFLDVAFLN